MGLDTGDYAVVESAVPARPVGLVMLGHQWWTFSVDTETSTITAPVGHSTDAAEYPPVNMAFDNETGRFTLENELPTFNISVTKDWVGNVPVNEDLVFDLYIGSATEPFRTARVQVPSGSHWVINDLFTNLGVYDANGSIAVYTLVERNLSGYAAVSPVAGRVTFSAPTTGDYNAEFTNESLGSLDVEKWVEDARDDENTEFVFNLALTGITEEEKNATYSYLKYENNSQIPYNRTATAVDGVLTFTLKHGERVHFYDLPVGAEYTVVETSADGYHLLSSGGETGITDNTTTPVASFLNGESFGELEIYKRILSGDVSTPFDVTVTLTNKDGAKIRGTFPVTVSGSSRETPDTITFTNGRATFSICAGETWRIGKLPEGAVYTVTETNLPSYWTQVTPEDNLTGTIELDMFRTAELENVYAASPAFIRLGGRKTLTGKALTEGEFSFTLTGSDGTNETVTNSASGVFVFPEIWYTEAGTYYYVVTEECTFEDGITYDSTEYNITVEVTDNGSGQLTANVTGADANALNFANSYRAQSTSIQFEGVKTLTGKALTEGEFSFTLTGSDGTSETVTNAADGKITFTEITYTEAGTYTYEVKEEATEEAGIMIDDTVYSITVTVTDDGHGQLEAEVTGANVQALNFANTYSAASVSVQLGGTKTFTGYPAGATAPEFTYTLSENGDVIDTKTTQGAGEYSFDSITYDEAGTHTYIVKETNGGADGVTYDGTEYNITVEVTDNGSGQLVANVTGADANALNFANSYRAESTSIQFEGVKTLTGKALTAGEFSFTLTGSDGTNETVTNAADGKITFTEITYDEAGAYTYEVKENSTTEAGVTVDDTVYSITVTVTDDGHGQLEAEVTGAQADAIDFTNAYAPNSTSVEFSGTKTLSGKALTEGEFSFTLTGSDGTNETVTNAADGKIMFSEITYTEAGTYTYEVKEETTDEAGITIDDTIYSITVTVTDDGHGQLVAELSGDNAEALNFANSYQAGSASLTLGGTKTFENFPEDEEAPVFIFTLSENGEIIDVKTTRGAGSYRFASITYDEPGTYEYTVKETKGNAAGVTYDDTVYTFLVTVTDDGSGTLVVTVEGADPEALNFTNVYSPEDDGELTDEDPGGHTEDRTESSIYCMIRCIDP